MSLTTRVGLLVGVSALTGVSAAASPTQSDVDARIAELEAQVARLKSAQNENWLTEQRAEEIRDLVQDVLADADTRASLLQSGMTAGYDNGFMIGSSDGNFTLKMNGQLQVRHVTNYADQGSGSRDENRRGFENTRTKLMFSGNVAGPAWTYRIEGDFARNGGGFALDDGYIQWAFADGWNVQVGQRKLPLQREWLVHSSNQLAVERSNLSYVQGATRSQGVFVNWEPSDQLRLVMSYNDGITSGGTTPTTIAVTGGNTPWSVYDTEYAFTARGEFLISGNWDQFDDFTSPQGSEQGMMLGAAIHYERQEYGSTAANELEIFQITGDFSVEMDGWNAFASVSYSALDNDTSGAASIDANPLGFVVQGGYYFMEDLEGFVRFEWADLDNNILSSDEISIITFGINKYWSDNVKWSTDIGWGLEEISVAADITGFRTDVPGEDGQFVLRSQWQLVF